MTVRDGVAQRRRKSTKLTGGIRTVVLLDGVQTPAVLSAPDAEGREMLWQGEFIQSALKAGELAWYTVNKVFRTDKTGCSSYARQHGERTMRPWRGCCPSSWRSRLTARSRTWSMTTGRCTVSPR